MSRHDLHPWNQPPVGAMRTKYWDTGAFILFSSMLLHTKPEPLSYVAMVVLCFTAISTALHECRQMWALETDRGSPESTRRLLLFILVPTALFATLVVLRGLGRIVWSDLYFQVPLALFCGIKGIAAWLTEWKKKVQIYEELRGFVFVSIKPMVDEMSGRGDM